MGYCGGVSRALKMAEQAIDRARKEGVPVYSLGKLIHNKQVYERLGSEGLKEINHPEGREPGLVVVRAHGIPDDLRQEFTDSTFQLIDATCPVVKHNLRRIAHYCRTHHIIIVGHKGHPETVAMQGVTVQGELCPSTLITSADEMGSYEAGARYAVFVQTTFNELDWKLIQAQLTRWSESGCEVVFVNEICASSINRRSALLALARECDGIVVIGGKESANTRALYDLALQQGVKAWHIESADEVDPQMYDCDILGITAGASTPPDLIDAVVAKLHKE